MSSSMDEMHHTSSHAPAEKEAECKDCSKDCSTNKSSDKSDKTRFYLGLLLGVSVMSIIGLAIALAVLFSGKPVVNANAPAPTAAAPTAAAPSDPTAAQQPSGPVQLKEITKDDHIRGNADSKVTVVTFTDLECPFCKRFHEDGLKQAFDAYKDKVRFVYKSFPLETIHPHARKAAEASECAAEQGKYYDFVEKVFANQAQIGDALFTQTAKELKLDEKKFADCVSTSKYKAKIDGQVQEGFAAGVEGTPASFVNGVPVLGAVSFAELKAQIDTTLSSAK